MPDIRNFTITPLASASITVPRAEVSCTVHDSNSGVELGDFTGANAVTFPNVLSTLTNDERLEFVEMIAGWLLQKKRPDLWQS
jgi:hypothetical protein